jgi:hypothetical protein
MQHNAVTMDDDDTYGALTCVQGYEVYPDRIVDFSNKVSQQNRSGRMKSIH